MGSEIKQHIQRGSWGKTQVWAKAEQKQRRGAGPLKGRGKKVLALGVFRGSAPLCGAIADSALGSKMKPAGSALRPEEKTGSARGLGENAGLGESRAKAAAGFFQERALLWKWLKGWPSKRARQKAFGAG